VCGEETALIASIEGKRGTPRPRPPFPPVRAVGRPTLINNVETFANIAPIIRNGGEWYAAIGTEKSKGTKVFALAGRVNNTGLIEVPMGITLREIIFEIGGGIPDGKKFKAVQTGGPSGGCIPEQFLDMPVDYESLAQAGSIMGSGGMIVMDETSCMVDVAKFFMDFCMTSRAASAFPAAWAPCRCTIAGEASRTGRGAAGPGRCSRTVRHGEEHQPVRAGQTAPNPVLSTLRYFRDEYDGAHRRSTCPAGSASGHDGAKEVTHEQGEVRVKP
jgi:NADH:ubiquinone oxidoreductase subunit F (NADH-binding)